MAGLVYVNGNLLTQDPGRPRAERLREEISATLSVEIRELSDEPRGPHPVPQFRFTFTAAQFGDGDFSSYSFDHDADLVFSGKAASRGPFGFANQCASDCA